MGEQGHEDRSTLAIMCIERKGHPMKILQVRHKLRYSLVAATALVLGGGAVAYSATRAPTATCTAAPTITVGATSESFSVKCSVPRPAPSTKTVTVTKTVTKTVTRTVTASPSTTAGTPAPPTTTTVTPPPTNTTTTTTTAPSGAWKCTASLGDGCGAYDYAGIPNSNGYNTYVEDQSVGPQSGTSETVHANSPGDWEVVAHDMPLGYRGVQSFPDVQQLFNNWGSGGWNGSSDTPVDSLSTLKVTYSETSPTAATSIYEFAADVWQDNYGSDVMFWVDTHGRCDEGAFGSTVLGHAVIDGQNWTVHRYGGAGAEVIFVLDGPGGPGTCAQQSSGTIDVKAGLDWLVANGFESGPPVISQLNTGWEITSADSTTFRMNGYSIQATAK